MGRIMDNNMERTFAQSLKSMMDAWDWLQASVSEQFPGASEGDVYQMTDSLFKAALPQWAALANTKRTRGKS